MRNRYTFYWLEQRDFIIFITAEARSFSSQNENAATAPAANLQIRVISIFAFPSKPPLWFYYFSSFDILDIWLEWFHYIAQASLLKDIFFSSLLFNYFCGWYFHSFSIPFWFSCYAYNYSLRLAVNTAMPSGPRQHTPNTSSNAYLTSRY